jgi:hypothetical protein
MKIIFKVNEDGNICLYDTRSEQFFKGCCVRSEELGKPLLDLANNVVKKPYKAILELAQSFVYQDNGYLECMIAKKYVDLNQFVLLLLISGCFLFSTNLVFFFIASTFDLVLLFF